MSTVLVFLLAAGVAAFVLAPLFRPDAAEAERVSRGLSEAQELQSQREMAMQALRDLEDDRSTGKIGDDDYAEMKARLSARAVDTLPRLDAPDGPGAGPAPSRPHHRPGLERKRLSTSPSLKPSLSNIPSIGKEFLLAPPHVLSIVMLRVMWLSSLRASLKRPLHW